MNKWDNGELSNEFSMNESRSIVDVPLAYCDRCFIAFGSQEKRAYFDGKVVHPDCAKKMK